MSRRRRPPRRRRAEPALEQRPRRAGPARVRPSRLPSTTIAPSIGRWLWTCRPGFENALFEELAWLGGTPRLLGPALVESRSVAPALPTFGRTGFPVAAVVSRPEEASAALSPAPTVVQVWLPDTDATNTRAAVATAWERQLRASRAAQGDPGTPWQAFERGALLGQVCLFDGARAAVGTVPARSAVTLSAGGRTRMKRRREAPSRAALKLDEALEWFGCSPGPGDRCVDLGAAPGGWTRRLVDLGAEVVSVDPAKLAPDLAPHPRVRHVQMSAFDFEPTRPVDWLLCDMVWRPREVGLLLARWGRRGWAQTLLANFKLPMRDKLPVVWDLRAELESAGWKSVKTRHLYHDREEVTLTAHR